MGFKIKQLLVEKLPEDTPEFQQFPGMIAELKRDFAVPSACFIMAYDDRSAQKIIGVGGIRDMGGYSCEVKRLVVWWDFQKMGVGRQLLEMLIKQAVIRGYRKMRVQVPTSVPALVRFYQKMGFAEVPPFRICSPEEFVFMELAL